MPGLDRRDDLGRDAQGCVDFLVLRLGGCGLANLEHATVGGRQYDRDDLMRAELLAEGPLRGVNAGLDEAVFDGDEQVVGQDA